MPLQNIFRPNIQNIFGTIILFIASLWLFVIPCTHYFIPPNNGELEIRNIACPVNPLLVNSTSTSLFKYFDSIDAGLLKYKTPLTLAVLAISYILSSLFTNLLPKVLFKQENKEILP